MAFQKGRLVLATLSFPMVFRNVGSPLLHSPGHPPRPACFQRTLGDWATLHRGTRRNRKPTPELRKGPTNMVGDPLSPSPICPASWGLASPGEAVPAELQIRCLMSVLNQTWPVHGFLCHGWWPGPLCFVPWLTARRLHRGSVWLICRVSWAFLVRFDSGSGRCLLPVQQPCLRSVWKVPPGPSGPPEVLHILTRRAQTPRS